MRKKILAMEEMEGEVASGPIEADTEEVQILQEAQGHEAEMTSTLDQAVEATDVADTLDTMQSSLNGAERISPPVATALDVAVEHFLVRLGAPIAQAHVAMEDNAQSVAAVGNKIKSIVAAVINAMKKALEHLANFFRAMFNGSKKLQLRAKMIKNRLKSKPPGHKTGDSINPSNSNSFVYLLKVDNKFPDERTFLNHLKRMETEAVFNVNYGAIASEANTVIGKMFDDAIAAGDRSTVEGRDMVARLTANLRAEEVMPFGDVTYHAAGLSDQPDSHLKMDENFARFTISFSSSHDGEQRTAAHLTPLSDGGIGLAADLVLAGLSKFDKREREIGEMSVAFKKLLQHLSSVVNARLFEGPAVVNSKKIARDITYLKDALMKSATMLSGYQLKTYKAALDYAAASLAPRS